VEHNRERGRGRHLSGLVVKAAARLRALRQSALPLRTKGRGRNGRGTVQGVGKPGCPLLSAAR
jgi:hypothetical protein